MKTLFFILATVTLFSCSESKFKNEIMKFELRLAESEPHPNFVEMNLFNSNQKFFISDSIFLTNDDITSAEVIDWETHPNVMVILNDKGREKFAVFTQKHIGKNAAILVDQKLVSAPRINAPITEGKLIIVGLFDHEEAQKIARGIVP